MLSVLEYKDWVEAKERIKQIITHMQKEIEIHELHLGAVSRKIKDMEAEGKGVKDKEDTATSEKCTKGVG